MIKTNVSKSKTPVTPIKYLHVPVSAELLAEINVCAAYARISVKAYVTERLSLAVEKDSARRK